jgi:hypothetical protein
MLKRNIGVVVAGVLLGAQIGFATADESAVPLGAQAVRMQSEPVARSTYQTGRTASSAPSRTVSMPSSDDEIISRGEPPVRSTYQDRHGGGNGSAE